MTVTEEDLKANPKLAALVHRAEVRDGPRMIPVISPEKHADMLIRSVLERPLSSIYIFDITPIGKPRMTRRDKWAKTRTKAAEKYMVFRNKLEWLLQEQGFELGHGVEIVFLLPFKKNWSKEQCIAMRGLPHLEKPDTDNMLKAFIDVACKRDEKVYSKAAHKFWWDRGLIVVVRNEAKYKDLMQIDTVYKALQGL